MGPIVDIKQAVKEYPLGKLVVRALRGVDLLIERGEFTAIAGPSGSGKTTLLNLIGCVDVATSGTVVVDGQPTGKLDDKALTNLRLHKLGFIFQTFNLVNVLTLYQNVEFPLLLKGGLSPADRKKRVEEMVEKVGLTQQMQQRPNELSGGQRQRVAIARALVTKPAIVLADEPTANLDSVTGQNIIDLMRHINEADKTTFIFSTHDHRVMEHARRIVRLEDGLIADPDASMPSMPANSGPARPATVRS
jgi:putative ABC transport system ATP-binding protein